MEHERADDLVPPVRRQVLEVALRADGEGRGIDRPCDARALRR